MFRFLSKYSNWNLRCMYNIPLKKEYLVKCLGAALTQDVTQSCVLWFLNVLLALGDKYFHTSNINEQRTSRLQ